MQKDFEWIPEEVFTKKVMKQGTLDIHKGKELVIEEIKKMLTEK